MKVSTSTATRGSERGTTNSTIEATVFVDGVGAVNNGGKYTDPTSSLQVKKSLQGSSIEFVAPRWQLYVQHKIAHVKRDGWHYLNMEVKLTSMLKTPVTGVLGDTYSPETYLHNLQDANEASHGGADHPASSLRALKGAMPRGLLIYPADEGSTSTVLRQLLAKKPCCNGIPYDPNSSLCCGGVICAKPASQPACCGPTSYSGSSQMCCNNVVNVKPTIQPACCGAASYSGSSQMCCDNIVNIKPNTQPACCGAVSYSAFSQMCCDNVVNDKPTSQPACCGTKSFSQAFLFCCPGNIIKSSC
jgi:hypothetical protein